MSSAVSGIPDGVPLDQIPSAEPPAGATPNFVDPPTKAVELIVIDAVFTSLMLLALLLRVLVRLRWTKGWGWHDNFCILAALASLTHMIINIETAKFGFGRHMWDIPLSTFLSPSWPTNNRLLVSAAVTFPLATLFIKVSILLLYLRVFAVSRGLRINVYVGVVVLTLFYTAMIGAGIATMVNCVGLVQTNPICHLTSNQLSLSTSCFNVATDCWIFILPMPLILKLNLQLKRKIGLIAVFAIALAAVAASIARLVLFSVHYYTEDVFWYAAEESAISAIELNIGIIVSCSTCMPSFFMKTKLYLQSTTSTIWERMQSLLASRNSSQRQRSDDGYELYDELQENPLTVKTGPFAVESSATRGDHM